MIVAPAGVKVHLALGHTDMREGLDGPATLIQEHLKKDSFCGHLFVLLAFLSVAQRTYSYPLSPRIL